MIYRLFTKHGNERKLLADALVTAIRKGQWRSIENSPIQHKRQATKVLGAHRPLRRPDLCSEHSLVEFLPGVPDLGVANFVLRLMESSYRSALLKLQREGLHEHWEALVNDEGRYLRVFYPLTHVVRRHRDVSDEAGKASLLVLEYAEVKPVPPHVATRFKIKQERSATVTG